MCFTQIAGSQDVIAFDASGQEVFSMESSSTDAFHRGIRVVHLEPARGSWICLSTAASEVALLVIDDGGEKSWVERNLPTSCLTSIHDDNLSHEGYVVAGLEAGSLQVREAANGHLVFRTVRAHDAVIALDCRETLVVSMGREGKIILWRFSGVSLSQEWEHQGGGGLTDISMFPAAEPTRVKLVTACPERRLLSMWDVDLKSKSEKKVEVTTGVSMKDQRQCDRKAAHFGIKLANFIRFRK